MKAQFKKGMLIRDNCGCKLEVLKVGRKYYTVINRSPVLLSAEVDLKGNFKKIDEKDYEEFPYQIEIKKLDKRGTLLK